MDIILSIYCDWRIFPEILSPGTCPDIQFEGDAHYVKSVRIQSYSGPYFPEFGLNKDKSNSEYWHFLRSGRNENINSISK